MVYRVADPGIFGFTVVVKVYLAVCIKHQVFKQGIPSDRTIDIRLCFFTQLDAFGIASALEVEYAVIVPSMFIITDQGTFGIGRKRGLACSGKSEEYGCIPIFSHVCRTVHGSDPAKRKIVVHNGEESFLDLPPIP